MDVHGQPDLQTPRNATGDQGNPNYAIGRVTPDYPHNTSSHWPSGIPQSLDYLRGMII